MVKLIVDGVSALLAVIVVGLAVRKWHIIRNRHLILSTIRTALNERIAFRIGTLAGVFYMTVFMILGGKGGRIHVLFGRLIFNSSAGEILEGILLAFLVMISMSLFVYGMQATGIKRSGKESGIGLFGAFMSVLAAFCP
jgi:hypothetical protein